MVFTRGDKLGYKRSWSAVRPIARDGCFQARTPTEESIETQSMSVTFERMRSCLGRKSAWRAVSTCNLGTLKQVP